MDKSDIEFGIQVLVTLIAAISYFIVYRQQKPLLKTYKDAFEQFEKQMSLLKSMYSMDSLKAVIDWNIAVKTPEIEEDFRKRLSGQGKGIISQDEVVELLQQVYKVALFLYDHDVKVNGSTDTFEQFISKEYPKSRELIGYYLEDIGYYSAQPSTQVK